MQNIRRTGSPSLALAPFGFPRFTIGHGHEVSPLVLDKPSILPDGYEDDADAWSLPTGPITFDYVISASTVGSPQVERNAGVPAARRNCQFRPGETTFGQW